MPAPTDISGLVHRFRASQLTGFTNGTGVASAAFETGGITLTQSTSTNQPTYVTNSVNGQAGLRFNGTSSYISGSLSTQVAQPLTMTFIMKISDAAASQQILDGAIQLYLNSGDNAYQVYSGGYFYGSKPTIGNHAVTIIANGSASSLYVDGVLIASGSTSGNLSQYPIGAKGGIRYLNGDINEIIVYGKALSLVELNTLDTYIQSIYAITMADAVANTSTNSRMIRANDLARKLIASAGYKPSSQQGGNYTLALSDLGTIIEIINTTATVVTVPANASVAFTVGSTIQVMQYGAGRVQIVAATGVTLDAAGGLYASKQYSVITLRKRATDEWVVFGDTASS